MEHTRSIVAVADEGMTCSIFNDVIITVIDKALGVNGVVAGDVEGTTSGQFLPADKRLSYSAFVIAEILNQGHEDVVRVGGTFAVSVNHVHGTAHIGHQLCYSTIMAVGPILGLIVWHVRPVVSGLGEVDCLS